MRHAAYIWFASHSYVTLPSCLNVCAWSIFCNRSCRTRERGMSLTCERGNSQTWRSHAMYTWYVEESHHVWMLHIALALKCVSASSHDDATLIFKYLCFANRWFLWHTPPPLHTHRTHACACACMGYTELYPTHTPMYICLHTCSHVRDTILIHILISCAQICVMTHSHVCMHVSMYVTLSCTLILTYTHACLHAHVFMYVTKYAFICISHAHM